MQIFIALAFSLTAWYNEIQQLEENVGDINTVKNT